MIATWWNSRQQRKQKKLYFPGAPNSSLRILAASTQPLKAARTPAFSRAKVPSMVLPPGEQIWSCKNSASFTWFVVTTERIALSRISTTINRETEKMCLCNLTETGYVYLRAPDSLN